MSTTQENIKVVVRVRPLSQSETKSNSGNIIRYPSPNELHINNKLYKFNKVFSPDCSQADVFNYLVAPMIADVIGGYNCTVFSYGQTGSGKTHTICGPKPTDAQRWIDNTNAGIIPRAIDTMMKQINGLGPQEGQPTIKVSFIELYNEEVYDLLSDNINLPSLNIYNDPTNKGALCIQNLSEIQVNNCVDVFDLYKLGNERREFAPTLMNHQSSRSHTVFTISVTLHQGKGSDKGVFKFGKLNLVDLAGSENGLKSGTSNLRLLESANINRSLLTLGRVIQILAEKTAQYVPFRDSKLTRILQTSLGGNAKTSMIATISPAESNYEESVNTLEYAQRTRNIQNCPHVNEQVISYKDVEQLQKELDQLRAEKTEGFFMHPVTYNEFLEEPKHDKMKLEAMDQNIETLKETVARKKEICEIKQQQTDKLKASVEEMKQKIAQYQSQNEQLEQQIKQELEFSDKLEKNQDELRAANENLLQEASEQSKRQELLHRKKEVTLNSTAENQLVAQKLLKTIEQGAQSVEDEKNKAVDKEEEVLLNFRKNLDEIAFDIDDCVHFYQQFNGNMYPKPSNETSTKFNCTDQMDKMFDVHLDFVEFNARQDEQLEKDNDFANYFSQLSEDLKSIDIVEPDQELIQLDDEINEQLLKIVDEINSLNIATKETTERFPNSCSWQQKTLSNMVEEVQPSIDAIKSEPSGLRVNNYHSKRKEIKETTFNFIHLQVSERYEEIGAKIIVLKDSLSNIEENCSRVLQQYRESIEIQMEEVDASRYFYVRYLDSILSKKRELLATLDRFKEVLDYEDRQLSDNFDIINNYSNSVNDLLHEMQIIVTSFKKKIVPVARAGDTPILKSLTEHNVNISKVQRIDLFNKLGRNIDG